MKNYPLRALLAFMILYVVSPLYAVDFTVDNHPRLLVNQQAIDNAKKNIDKYEWAAQNAQALIKFADDFKVPPRREFTVKRPAGQWPSLGYVPKDIENLYTVGLAWTITDNNDYLSKLKSFVLDVCDPEKGYIPVGAATTGVEVHEGGFFFYFAAICDILYSRDDILTNVQKSQIEAVMRTYLEKSKSEMHPNGIMNHQASTNASAVLVSMFLKDEGYFNHFVEADGGMMDHIGTGVMPDGWWFEATVNYCYLVTNIYFRMAQVFQNNGIDLYNMKVDSRPMDKDFHNAPDEFAGMKFAVWGPDPRPYRTLYDMAMAYIPMMDEDGVVLASNDSGTVAPDEFYELAYKEYGDKELAWVISKTDRSSWISLFYGEGKLPKVSDPRTKSATVPNVGLTALRSQNKQRQGAEQLQAYFKYGSHGGWHGHFDRVSLQALDKYGHKYFGTEMCWFGYGSAQYKELVQSTITHNMVMVGEMQQQALPSCQPIFYAGDMMQLSLTQTEAKWRIIPRHNSDRFPPWDDVDYATEPIMQRRLSLVTDDYLVMFDYLSSDEVRQYDLLAHPLGFVGVEGAKMVGSESETVSTDENSPFKYFTKGQWYKGGEDVVKFKFNDKGFGLDYYPLYPKSADILYAHYPTTGKVSHDFKNNPDRRTVAVRVNSKDVVFISLMEPYKVESAISKIDVVGEDEIIVTLKCGTTQRIKVKDLKGKAEDIKVEFTSTTPNGKSKTEVN